MNVQVRRLQVAALSLAMAGARFAQADQTLKYEVTITNTTKGQTFTPQLIATHSARVAVFELGATASPGLEALAESGDTSGVADDLLANGYQVNDVQTVPGLLEPGNSVTVTLEASPHHRFFSLAAMLIPTNDTFVALNGVKLPSKHSATYTALAYDAGTEANDQNRASIPGPRCMGEGNSPGPNEDDEGYIYISNGFHELGADKDATSSGASVLRISSKTVFRKA